VTCGEITTATQLWRQWERDSMLSDDGERRRRQIEVASCKPARYGDVWCLFPPTPTVHPHISFIGNTCGLVSSSNIGLFSRHERDCWDSSCRQHINHLPKLTTFRCLYPAPGLKRAGTRDADFVNSNNLHKTIE